MRTSSTAVDHWRLLLRGLAAASLAAIPLPVHAQASVGPDARIEFDELDGTGFIAPQLLLQGRVAGVEVIDDPTPGGGVSIRIRGGGSILNSEPLYVVDGMPLNFGGGITAGSNPLAFVDVADVEAITVLKSASAATRYGARGSNGVVLIETKSGAATRLAYTGTLAASAAMSAPDVLDADAFRAAVAAYDAEFGTDFSADLGNASTDWRDAVQRTGIGHDHSLAYAGSGEDLTYRISGGYTSDDGVVSGTGAELATISLGYAQSFADDRLHLRATLRGSHEDDDFLAPGVLAATHAMAPTQPIRDAASPYGGYFEWPNALAPQNPVALLELTEDAGTTRRGFGVVEAQVDFPFTQPLSAIIRLGLDGSGFERDASQAPELKRQALGPFPGFTSRLDGEMNNSVFGAFLNHRRAMGVLGFDVTAGWSTEEFDLDADYEQEEDGSGSGFGWSIALDGKLSSLLAHAEIALMERYVVSLGVRSDADDEERFTYPSAGFAWRLSDEAFMDAIPALGSLTLRGSWGQSGTIDITRLIFPSAFDIGRTMSAYQFGSGSPVFTPVDPELEPEEMTAFDVGFDAASAGGRVTASLDLYSRTTEGLWAAAPFVITNVGTLVNRGFELSVDALLLRGDERGLEWRAGFVASTSRGEITQLDFPAILTGPIAGGFGNFIQVLEEGESPNAFHVYRRRADNPDFGDMDGDGDVDATDLYTDLDGNGVINLDDARAHESPAPRWILGHTSRLRWRGFDANFTLRAHLGNHVYNNVASSRGYSGALAATGSPANLHESVNATGFAAPQFFSDYYVEDASFLRMDHVTVGWTPGRGPVRVFGTVRNAFTLTEYRGPDPVVGPSGIDYDNYPRARSMMVGANVRF